MESLFVLEDVGRDNISVKILEIEKTSYGEIDSVLKLDESEYVANAVIFDGLYKPDVDESLKIVDFELPNDCLLYTSQKASLTEEYSIFTKDHVSYAKINRDFFSNKNIFSEEFLKTYDHLNFIW